MKLYKGSVLIDLRKTHHNHGWLTKNLAFEKLCIHLIVHRDISYLHLTYKHLSAVRSMADKCLLDYAAHQAGTLFNRGYCFL